MAHVFDQWTRENPETSRRVRTERWGKGKRWLARWESGDTRSSKAFATRDEAEDFLAKIRTGVVRASQPDGLPTVAQWLETWRGAQVHHRKSTGGSTAQYVTRVTAALGTRRIDELTRADVQAMITEWSTSGTYSPSTIRSTYTALTGSMKLAVADGLLDASPCAGVKLPKVERPRVVPLTTDQVTTIAGRVPEHYRAMVWLAAASGMRGGELRGLTPDRISGTVITVDRQLIEREGRTPVFGPPKSDAGVRTIDVGQTAMDVLADHINRHQLGEGGLVFVGRTRAPLRRPDMSEVWRAATHDMKLRPRSGFHDLRHYHASLLIAAGLSVRAVADRLGHADVSETLETYSHLWPSDEARVVAAVEAILRPVCDLTRPANAA